MPVSSLWQRFRHTRVCFSVRECVNSACAEFPNHAEERDVGFRLSTSSHVQYDSQLTIRTGNPYACDFFLKCSLHNGQK